MRYFGCPDSFLRIKNAVADNWNPENIQQIAFFNTADLRTRNIVLLKINLKDYYSKPMSLVLPSLHIPLVNLLVNNGWSAFEKIVNPHQVRALIPKLKLPSAWGILEVDQKKYARVFPLLPSITVTHSWHRLFTSLFFLTSFSQKFLQPPTKKICSYDLPLRRLTS